MGLVLDLVPVLAVPLLVGAVILLVERLRRRGTRGR
jgi:hypothetical protein